MTGIETDGIAPDRLTDIARWFAELTPASLAGIGRIYAAQAHFKDPFNDVEGIERVRQVYEHMFEGLPSARFEIDHVLPSGPQGFVVWRFLARWRDHDVVVHGSSHLVLDGQGLIIDHRDYWDTGEELYEKIPVLGAILRVIKKKLAT